MGRDATSVAPSDAPCGDDAAYVAKGPHPLDVCQTQRVKVVSDVERVQRKWQMASCNHFLHVFAPHLPLKLVSEDAAEDLTPEALERAVAAPEQSAQSCALLRDVIMALLLALDAVSLKSVHSAWYQALCVLVDANAELFADCFQFGTNELTHYRDGMHFITTAGWHVRLGLLLALCDMAAERAKCVRDAIRDSELASTITNSDLDHKGFRLQPLGRCSQRRFHYKVGATRIYSGYKRKGTGALLVECSDSRTMALLADALATSPFPRDATLATDIRTKFLAPLQELELRARRKAERKLQEQRLRDESRRRNSVRPRRANATYL
ncbi:unnamed protein product [Agarophyton chilense]|eukprot:gb/GEZJ01001436.1/.p1 GENE.gb/GEZJ01001436.1/~~gb/GEZJ01001436.1/.p1  ORF type:complete len:324 (-),score=37.59 gb/GEZJ01001436.1/:970-1941(-)